jgi:Short C-terminal domain
MAKEEAMPKRHGLGVGNGKLIEYEDGSAGYVPTASFTQAFRVQIADVTGFSVTKGTKMLERQINVLGNGTLLASASVPHGTPEKIEHWFRAHPLFGQRAATPEAFAPPASEAAPTAMIADELRKLADLRSEGILTDEEFAAQKALLLQQ